MTDNTPQLIFLGTGTGVPSPHRASPAILLKLSGAHILIDMGPGTLRQLAQISVSITKIDYILLTHLHPDHTADLVPFLFGSKYPPYLINRSRIRLVAGTDFNPFYQGLRDLYGTWIELPPDVFQVNTLPENGSLEKDFPFFRLISSPMVHTASSLGYRLILPDRKILVFSGDSDYSTQLVELAQNADLLVLECSFPEGEKVAGHLTPSLAGKIARQAEVKALVLTHFYPECSGQDLLEPCAREFSGPITLAEDFLTLSI